MEECVAFYISRGHLQRTSGLWGGVVLKFRTFPDGEGGWFVKIQTSENYSELIRSLIEIPIWERSHMTLSSTYGSFQKLTVEGVCRSHADVRKEVVSKTEV